MSDSDFDVITRHREKGYLFNLLVADYTRDASLAIANMKAIMETEDVVWVEGQFEAWKKEQEAKKG